MASIEELALQKYQKNLDYFRKEHEATYAKVSLITKAIEDGAYIEKYALEYINDAFDVLELSSKQYLYAKDSDNYTKEATKQVNFKKSDSVLESFYRQTVTDEIVKKYDGKVPVDSPLYATAKIIKYANDLREESHEMKYISKYIFAGVGLGMHLKPIVQKVKAHYVFIMENNLELFRLSLFTTDYEELSKDIMLYFAILNNDDVEFKMIFKEFHKQSYNDNQYIKYSLFSDDNTKDIEHLQYLIITSMEIAYPYSSALQELLKAPEYILEGFPFVDFVNRSIDSPFVTKPVLLIAAGPSLNENIEWLQKNQNKFYLVAILAASKTLYKANIKPDLVLHMDPRSATDTLYNTINIDDFFDKTLFLFSSMVSRNTIDSFPKERVYCFETISKYKTDHINVTSPSIGEITYAITLLLGVKKLYLLGLDLALDPETKRTHALEHTNSRIIDEDSSQNDPISLGGTIQYVKGNFLNEVPTLPIFKISITEFKLYSIAHKKQNQDVYNLANGAYLEGSVPLQIEDFDTSNLVETLKDEKLQILQTFFQTISDRTLTPKDIALFDARINEAKRLLEYTLEFKQNVSTSNYEVYMRSFIGLTTELINTGKYRAEQQDINNILYNYLYYTVGYIFNIFNTKDLKNQKRHLKKINMIFLEQIEKMLNLYITTMEVYRSYLK